MKAAPDHFFCTSNAMDAFVVLSGLVKGDAIQDFGNLANCMIRYCYRDYKVDTVTMFRLMREIVNDLTDRK